MREWPDIGRITVSCAELPTFRCLCGFGCMVLSVAILAVVQSTCLVSLAALLVVHTKLYLFVSISSGDILWVP